MMLMTGSEHPSKIIGSNRKYRNNNIEKITVKGIVVFMLSLTMLVDFVNGILPWLHIGELFRVLLLLICSIYIIKYGSRNTKKYMLIVAYLCINATLTALIYDGGLLTNLTMAMKSCILFAVFLTLMLMYKRSAINIQDIENVIERNLLYAPGLFIGSYIFGIGNFSYSFSGQNLGFKSGFLSLNSVNIALMVLYIFAVNKVFYSKSKKWFVLALYVAVPLAMLGTKTGYAIIVAVPILFTLLGIKRRKTWCILILCIIAIAVASKFFADNVLPYFQGVIDRQMLLYSQRGFWTYLTSTRNLRVKTILSYYFNHSNPVSILFGSGYYWIHSIAAGMESSTSAPIPLEMDWADLLVTYGVVGMVFSYMFIIKRLLAARSLKNNRGGVQHTSGLLSYFSYMEYLQVIFSSRQYRQHSTELLLLVCVFQKAIWSLRSCIKLSHFYILTESCFESERRC